MINNFYMIILSIVEIVKVIFLTSVAVLIISSFFYSFRMKVKLLKLKKQLYSPNNKEIYRDIKSIKIKCKRDYVIVKLHDNAFDYTVQDKLDNLQNNLIRRLNITFNLSFNDKKENGYIVFVAKRKQKRWSLRGLLR